MRTWSSRRPVALALFALGVSACSGVVSMRKLADAFNGGALEAASDPFYDRSQRAQDTVMWRVRDELGNAYFGQGSGDARVVAWLDHLEAEAPTFMRDLIARELDGPAAASVVLAPVADTDAAAPAAAPAKEAPVSQQTVQAAIDRAASSISAGTEPFCDPAAPNRPNRAAVERFADYVRLEVGLGRAGAEAARLVRERFATMDEAVAGARRAFHGTATYLADRRWRREQGRHVSGLVVKGGAATGIFSAGVVYVALNLLDRCLSAGKCDPDRAGFAIASGTSTGATIVTAIDVFHSNLGDAKARAAALRSYRDWYMCSSMNDLYCVRQGTVFNLARGGGARPSDVQDSFLDFDGLAGKAEDAYRCPQMEDRMELVLNTVDFRTGRLYSLSDQDPATLRAPWDVAKAVVASAALPFIVRPVYNLPVDPVPNGRFAYLDGGIRSELPLLALIRRGVERLLVVSSGASVAGDRAPIDDGLDMAIRYIDISTGGVTEAEIEHARMRAEASRLAEYDYCRAIIDDDRSAKTRRSPSRTGPLLCSGHCDEDLLCAGDFAHACGRVAGERPRVSNERIVSETFQMVSVWRDESRIPGLPGYAFNPDEQRRLMLAGAEAARAQCRQIAATLDIVDVDDATLYRWCTPDLPTTEAQCGAERLKQLRNAPDAPDCANDDGPMPDPSKRSTASCARVRP